MHTDSEWWQVRCYDSLRKQRCFFFFLKPSLKSWMCWNFPARLFEAELFWSCRYTRSIFFKLLKQVINKEAVLLILCPTVLRFQALCRCFSLWVVLFCQRLSVFLVSVNYSWKPSALQPTSQSFLDCFQSLLFLLSRDWVSALHSVLRDVPCSPCPRRRRGREGGFLSGRGARAGAEPGQVHGLMFSPEGVELLKRRRDNEEEKKRSHPPARVQL